VVSSGYYGIGGNALGQLGLEDLDFREKPEFVYMPDIIDISCGFHFTMAVVGGTRTRLIAWGWGFGREACAIYNPRQLIDICDPVSVACGHNYAVTLTRCGVFLYKNHAFHKIDTGYGMLKNFPRGACMIIGIHACCKVPVVWGSGPEYGLIDDIAELYCRTRLFRTVPILMRPDKCNPSEDFDKLRAKLWCDVDQAFRESDMSSVPGRILALSGYESKHAVVLSTIGVYLRSVATTGVSDAFICIDTINW
jgi:hypothetical protein